jgi:DNA-binding transcriptional LysR family regulator
MDLVNAIRLFTKVVDTGSFSEAGRQLNLDQSSVSRQVSTLEDQLGVRLLNRTTRKLGLTEAGQLYYERAHVILSEIEEANQAVLQLSATPRGTLRLTVPVVFGRMHVAPALPGFLAQYPELKIDLTLTNHVTDLIEEGGDLAIRMGEPSSATLIVRKLAENPWVICASPDYLARQGTPELPEHLLHHNCLTRNPQVGGGHEWQFKGGDGLHSITVSGNLQTNNPEALRAAALGGLGLTRLSSWTVGKDLQSGALRRVLSGYEITPMGGEGPIYAVYPHNRHISAKVRVFVDYLARWLASHDPTRAGDGESAQQTTRRAG